MKQGVLVVIMAMTIISSGAQQQFFNDTNDYVFHQGSLFDSEVQFSNTGDYIKSRLLELDEINNNLNNKEALLKALDYMCDIRSKVTKMAQYGFLNARTNDTKESQNLLEVGDGMLTKVNTKLGAIEANILELNEKALKDWMIADKRFR